MPDDFGKDMLMLGGTVVGFIAALLTLMEKLLDVKNRLTSLTSKKERKSPSPIERPVSDSPSTASFFPRSPSVGCPISSCMKPVSSSRRACFSTILG
jgi:hypothetical protein